MSSGSWDLRLSAGCCSAPLVTRASPRPKCAGLATAPGRELYSTHARVGMGDAPISEKKLRGKGGSASRGSPVMPTVDDVLPQLQSNLTRVMISAQIGPNRIKPHRTETIWKKNNEADRRKDDNGISFPRPIRMQTSHSRSSREPSSSPSSRQPLTHCAPSTSVPSHSTMVNLSTSMSMLSQTQTSRGTVRPT